MPLTKTFQFSATSLQDYADCPRRFQLRYLLQVAWPAPEVEPIGEHERHTQLARDFHRLVHQHLLGLPIDALSASVHDVDLAGWWQAYLAYVPTFGDARLIPEVSLSVPLAGYRVVAQYDAIVVNYRHSAEGEEPDEAAFENSPLLLVVDWKTYRQRPPRSWLAQRLQTRVYPVVLVQAGSLFINQAPIEPDNVQMCYWLAEYPHTPEVFEYNTVTYQDDLDHLSALIAEITQRVSDAGAEPSVTENIWPLTSEPRRCRFCNYRSLCERGGVAGLSADYGEADYQAEVTTDETGLGFDLDWGQVQEIAY